MNYIISDRWGILPFDDDIDIRTIDEAVVYAQYRAEKWNRKIYIRGKNIAFTVEPSGKVVNNITNKEE